MRKGNKVPNAADSLVTYIKGNTIPEIIFQAKITVPNFGPNQIIKKVCWVEGNQLLQWSIGTYGGTTIVDKSFSLNTPYVDDGRSLTISIDGTAFWPFVVVNLQTAFISKYTETMTNKFNEW